MKKILFIMLLILSSTVFGIETNLHNMTSMVGDNCVFNRGELKYEKSICENKNRVEIKVVKNHLADTDKNKTISLIKDYIVFDFIVIVINNLQKFEDNLNDLLIKYTFVDLKKLNDKLFLFIGEEK